MYRWLAYDLMSNTALEELPLSSPTFGGELCGAGEFNAKLSLFHPDPVISAALTAASIPERTIVFPERNGVLVGDGYIIWQRRRHDTGPAELVGLSFASILRRQRVVADLLYQGVDQFTIAKGLIDHLQSQPGAGFGIVVPAVTSGVLRDRQYYAYERKNLGDALSQLGDVENGFEWGIDAAWSGGVPVKTLHLSYPRRGRIAGSTGLIFELGKNLIKYDILEDGSRSARTVDILGGGDGAAMQIATRTRTDLLDTGWPLTAEVVAAKDVTDPTTLNDHAAAAVAARAATPQFLTCEISPDDPDSGFGQWITGDDVKVRISDHQFPRTSAGPGLEAYYRIITYTMTVDDNGGEVLKVTLGAIS